MKRLNLLLLMITMVLVSAYAQKREFRGAWIQCVNGQFQDMSTATMQQTLQSQLDELQKDGVNAIIFPSHPFSATNSALCTRRSR